MCFIIFAKIMTKKEYVITVLDKLLTDWPAAAWLKVLIKKDLLDDAILNSIVGTLQEAVHNIWDKIKSKKLQKSIVIMNKIKQAEQNSINKEIEESLSLDQMLADL